MDEYVDITYEVRKRVAWITITRPEMMNAFRGRTCDELIGFQPGRLRPRVGVIVLTGAGDRAFCTGGDQSSHDGNYDGRGTSACRWRSCTPPSGTRPSP